MKKNLLLLVILCLGYFSYEYIYKAPKYSEGQEVMHFEATLLDGNSFDLRDLQGKYVLLDFWGSWCGPCRKESPHLVSLHKEFHNRSFDNASGFEIVSIGIERSEESWLSAIQKDNLDWEYHILQSNRFQSSIAQAYNVKEIPTKYLLDTKGKVISVNPSFPVIREFLLKG